MVAGRTIVTGMPSLSMCPPNGGFASPFGLIVRETGINERLPLCARYPGIAIDVGRADVQEAMEFGGMLSRGNQVLCTDDIGFKVGLLRRPIGGASRAVEDLRDLPNRLLQGHTIRQVATNHANRDCGQMAKI